MENSVIVITMSLVILGFGVLSTFNIYKYIKERMNKKPEYVPDEWDNWSDNNNV